MPSTRFLQTMEPYGIDLSPTSLEVLQVNITRLCNQACAHCHVDASPRRRERMSIATIDRCLQALADCEEIRILDLTGGAPELHPCFEDFVTSARALGRRVRVRHNLTVTLDPHPITGESMDHLPALFARHGVEVVSSLPCYEPSTTDEQRGSGVFATSIESLKRLNAVGYGVAGSGLRLDLAHNPSGVDLPGHQASLESDFRRELGQRHGVTFHRLLAMTNMPISRFRDHLERVDAYDGYMDRLQAACNPMAARGIMCRDMVSVAWNGMLYDCDFNQMLGLGIGRGHPLTIAEFDPAALRARDIRFSEHCFGCVAGAGSGCGGATCA